MSLETVVQIASVGLSVLLVPFCVYIVTSLQGIKEVLARMDERGTQTAREIERLRGDVKDLFDATDSLRQRVARLEGDNGK